MRVLVAMRSQCETLGRNGLRGGLGRALKTPKIPQLLFIELYEK